MDFKGYHLSRKQQQLVFYDEIKENRGKQLYSEEKQPDTPLNYLKTPEYLQIQKDLRNKLQQTLSKLQELIADFKNFNESEKKVEDPRLKDMINEYSELESRVKKLDHRRKYGNYEKIMMAYGMKNKYSIRQTAKLAGLSSKYCSGVSHDVLSKIGLGKLGKFNFNKTDTVFSKLKEILGQCPHCNVWIVDALYK